MAEFKKFSVVMTVDGEFPVKVTIEAENPDEQFVLLQQKAILGAEMGLLDAQMTNKI